MECNVDGMTMHADTDPLDEVLPGQGGMVPPLVPFLTDVLPTDRLNAKGMAGPGLRDELRRPHSVRNAANVAGAWLQSFGVIALACWLTPQLALPLALVVWAVTFLLMGRAFALYSILGHEAAHKLLFANKRVNDAVGRWCVAYPAFVPLDLYRRSHFAHHKEEFGPNEPDLNLYNHYPISRASMKRKLWRDANGTTGWKNLKGLLLALRSKGSRPIALRILTAQLGVFVILLGIGTIGVGGFTPARLWLYPVLWLAPWMTVWRVLNRLRGIAEHGGMMRSTDRRLTTHVVRQTLPARFWIVPYNTGWHLAHHVDMGVPFQQLPRFHDELVAAGWVVPDIEYRSYTALWRALTTPIPITPTDA
jgi:fatty acid desaturase